MNKANISEVFRSVQGEGKYLGVSQVFVRFFECNMHCVWCDTPHSIGDTSKRFKEYSLDELWEKISSLFTDCHSVSLTGGEPLMQTDFIKDLLPRFKDRKMPVYLETNGIFHKELSQIVDDIDIIAMDLKLPSSTQCQSYWEEHKKFLETASQTEVFVKTVVSSSTSFEDILKSMELVAESNPEILYILQPNFFDMNNGVINQCLQYQKQHVNRLKDIRIIPQTHKFMKLR